MAAKRAVTQIDIAKRLGIGQKTVSRVLAGDPTVGIELRDKVLAMAAELATASTAQY